MKRKSCIFLCSLLLCLFVVSCGKKGPPTPRTLALPGAIVDLSGEVKDGVLFLSFSMPEKNDDGSEMKDLGGFRILKACGSCYGGFEPFKEIRLDEQKGYSRAGNRLYLYDDDLAEGFEYSYRVHPYSLRGTRGPGSNTFHIRWERPPGPPAKVVAIGADGAVEIAWDKEPGLLYNVYRYQDGTYPLQPLNSRPLTGAGFVDSGLENGKVYQYEVRKVVESSGLKWEGQGVKVEATPRDMTPPAGPAQVVAERHEKGVMVTWKASGAADLAGYNVYRIVGGATTRLNTEPVKETTYIDSSVPDVRYLSYYVTALDRSGNESRPGRESIVILKE